MAEANTSSTSETPGPTMDCLQCLSLREDKHIAAHPRRYQLGDIAVLQASVIDAVNTHILAATRAQLFKKLPEMEEEEEQRSLPVHEDLKLKQRPAVVLKSRPVALGGVTRTSIMATLDNRPRRDSLPHVLRHFCIALFPHETIPHERGVYHVHTKPEWRQARSGRPNGWLLAFPFQHSGDPISRWKNREHVGDRDCSFTMLEDDGTLTVFTERCNSKWTEWMRLFQNNPESLTLYKQDFDVSNCPVLHCAIHRVLIIT
ncbi:hypothetical protein C8Q80DRAFT_475739 [Daedaleopsis nitida]|nr:hypothetical protein C8Q80DRAFT_475739 [Daedaleopsis nitida]